MGGPFPPTVWPVKHNMAGVLPLTITLTVLSFLFTTASAVSMDANNSEIFVILTEEVSDRNNKGVLRLSADVQHKIQLISVNIGDDIEVAFTPENKQDCETSKRTALFTPSSVNSRRTRADFLVTLDKLDPGEEQYHLCVKQSQIWTFHGLETWQQIAIREEEDEDASIFPIPLQVTIITGLLFLSGLFSGLNLGLMALDKTELRIIERCGSQNEKKYAKTITPLRKRGNFLLCTLLLGNVMVNSTATILLDDLSNGVVAVVVSTMCIVIFGEIIPQAVCSRHGLAVGAKTAIITRFFMVVTFPLSFPISLLLDKILGEEIGQVYNKEKLQELIRMTADHKVLQNEEANIISGALQLASKKVEDVMTKMEDVYMLDVNTVLDFEMMSEILKSGYTRVPVYDGQVTNIVHLLNTKELALIDPDDNTPVKTVCQFYDHRPLFVDHDVGLDAMLQDFLQGNSHMAIVQKLQNEGDCDPYYDNIGVVTLEDVIEEIIQSEIIDETDILTDNRGKKPRPRQRQLEYNIFEQKQEHVPRISQQVAFAAYQFLSTAVEPFKEEYVVRSVLKQLIRQNIFITITPGVEVQDKDYIFKRGEECDYFVLLLEGHVEVIIGKEDLLFDGGPFNYFGVESLDCLRDIKMEYLRDLKDLRSLPVYIPDFSVRAITQVQFLRIHRAHYLTARRTSYMMQSAQWEHCNEDTFHREWHRTVAANAPSSNSSAADTAKVKITAQEFGPKCVLKSENCGKGTGVKNCSPQPPGNKVDLQTAASKGRIGEDRAGMDSHINGSSCNQAGDSKGKESSLHPQDVEQKTAVSVIRARTCGAEEDNTQTSSLPEQSDEGTGAGLQDTPASPDGRTTFAEEEDESSPLVGQKCVKSKTANL